MGNQSIFLFCLSLLLSLFQQWVWLQLLMLSLTLRFLLLHTLVFRICYSNGSSLGPFYQQPLEPLISEGCINYLLDSDDYSYIDWAVLLVAAWNFLDSHCVKQFCKYPCLCLCYSFFFQGLLPCRISTTHSQDSHSHPLKFASKLQKFKNVMLFLFFTNITMSMQLFHVNTKIIKLKVMERWCVIPLCTLWISFIAIG